MSNYENYKRQNELDITKSMSNKTLSECLQMLKAHDEIFCEQSKINEVNLHMRSIMVREIREKILNQLGICKEKKDK